MASRSGTAGFRLSFCGRRGESQAGQDSRQMRADGRPTKEPSHPVSSLFFTEGIIMEAFLRFMKSSFRREGRETQAVIVSAAQPYFAPYPGYFARAALADVIVILDTVQFPQRSTWMTRNRFKNEAGTFWMAIPVLRKGFGFQKIREVRISREGNWTRKHLVSFSSSYGKAPFFEEHLPFLEGLFNDGDAMLLGMNLRIIRYLLLSFGIGTRLVLLSELGISSREPLLTVEICRSLKATEFLAPRPARKFIDEDALLSSGVKPRFYAFRTPVYPQLYGAFISDLSAFDLLFTCGPGAPGILRKGVTHVG